MPSKLTAKQIEATLIERNITNGHDVLETFAPDSVFGVYSNARWEGGWYVYKPSANKRKWFWHREEFDAWFIKHYGVKPERHNVVSPYYFLPQDWAKVVQSLSEEVTP